MKHYVNANEYEVIKQALVINHAVRKFEDEVMDVHGLDAKEKANHIIELCNEFLNNLDRALFNRREVVNVLQVKARYELVLY